MIYIKLYKYILHVRYWL